MKVVWFTNTPSLAETYINNKPAGGGWIKSLEKAIQKEVELSLIFYHHESLEPFKFGETTYYPIKTKRSGKLAELKSRMLSQLESREDISIFLKIIESIKPDLIHIHGTENQYGLIQQYTNIPTVVSVQGILSLCTYKYFSGISYLDVLKHSKISDLLLFKSFIQSYKSYSKATLREKEIFKHTKHVIGRTSWDKRVTKVLAPNATYNHNDEILRDVFYKIAWSYKPDDTLKLFTTTGPYIYKGIETMLYAAQLLDEHNIKFKWQIAGISKESRIVHLISKKLKKPISKNVELLGQLDEDGLINHLLQTHIYIMASHIENSPNNLCEAQILGVPCIATSAGGTSSLMKDNEDGILVQDGDPYVMAGAIIELKNNYENAILYGQNARKKALIRHDPKKIVEELLIVYNQLTNNTIKNKVNKLMLTV